MSIKDYDYKKITEEVKKSIKDAVIDCAVILFVDAPYIQDEYAICLYLMNDMRIYHVFLSDEEITDSTVVVYESLFNACNGYDEITKFIAEEYMHSGLSCGHFLQDYLDQAIDDIDDYIKAIDTHPEYADFLRKTIRFCFDHNRVEIDYSRIDQVVNFIIDERRKMNKDIILDGAPKGSGGIESWER